MPSARITGSLGRFWFPMPRIARMPRMPRRAHPGRKLDSGVLRGRFLHTLPTLCRKNGVFVWRVCKTSHKFCTPSTRKHYFCNKVSEGCAKINPQDQKIDIGGSGEGKLIGGVPEGPLGSPWEALGGPWGALGESLGSPWGLLGSPLGALGRLWGALGRLWEPLGMLWGALGRLWELLGKEKGGSEAQFSIYTNSRSTALAASYY